MDKLGVFNVNKTSMCLVTFPCSILCQVSYSIVSIPDIWHLSYFVIAIDNHRDRFFYPILAMPHKKYKFHNQNN